MYNLKNTLFLNLTKNQKASLMSFLKSFTKKHNEKSAQEIINLFIEDETYYFEQKNPHFEWIIGEFEKESFLKEIEKYILAIKKDLDMKEAQKPFLEKQKALMKEQRKKQQNFIMSKQPPTKKQLFYYEKLCKQHKIEPKETNGLSRLDLKEMISEILEESDAKTMD